jgi:hypothetical protein
MAQWQEATQNLGVTLPWHTQRANLLLGGIDLHKAVG